MSAAITAPRQRIRPGDDEPGLWQRFVASRCPDAKRRLVERYHRVIDEVAGPLHRRMPSYVEIGDLVSYGAFGLSKAIERFDPTRPDPFAGFAQVVIRCEMLSGVRREYRHHRGDRAQRSLDFTIGDAGDELSLGERVEAPDVTPAATEVTGEREELFVKLTRGLDATAKQLFRLRFFDGFSIENAAWAAGIDPEAAHSRMSKLLAHIRNTLPEAELLELLGAARRPTRRGKAMSRWIAKLEEIARESLDHASEPDEQMVWAKSKVKARVERSPELANRLFDELLDTALRDVFVRVRAPAPKGKGEGGNAAQQKAGNDAKAAGLKAMAGAFAKNLLDTWKLPGGKVLGDASRSEIEVGARKESRRAAAHAKNAAFLKLIAPRVADGKVARQCVKPEEAVDLLKQASLAGAA